MSDFIRYAFGKTSLGDVMVAASDRGVVALEFVDDRNVTEELLRSRFMDAKVVFDQTGLSLLLLCIRRAVDQPDGGSDIELDLRGTARLMKSRCGICFAKSRSARRRVTERSLRNWARATRAT